MSDVLLRFIHISDTHIHPDPNYTKDYAEITTYAGAKALVEQINMVPFEADFVLHTGDVAYDPDPEAYFACREILDDIRFPIYYLAGNHDNSVALQQQLMGVENPQHMLYYTEEINGVQLICVDSNGPAEPPSGFITEYQLGWLSGLCTAKDDRPLIIAVHHNVLPVDVPWLDNWMRIKNGEAFHEAILPARDRIRGVFYGHVHQNLDTLRDGILYSSTLSSWTQFHAWPNMERTTSDSSAEPGFSVVTVTANQTFIRRHRYPLPR